MHSGFSLIISYMYTADLVSVHMDWLKFREKILNGPLDVGVAGQLLYLESPSSLEVELFANNLGVYYYTQSPHGGHDVGLTQSFAGDDVWLVLHQKLWCRKFLPM